jgi:hypothetical protein
MSLSKPMNDGLRRIRQTPLRERWYLICLCLPIVALAGLIGLGVWREIQANRDLDTLLTMYRRQGVPMGNESLRVLYDEQTSMDVATRWQQVTDAAIAIEANYTNELIARNGDDLGRLVRPGEPWAISPAMDRLRQKAEPLIKEIKELSKTQKPIWDPMIFGGFETVYAALGKLRNLARVLSYVSSDAYHRGDHQKTIESLALISDVAEAHDSQLFTVSELVYIAIKDLHGALIRQSLASDYWTVEEVEKLKQQLPPVDDVEQRWQRMVVSEVAGMRASLGISDEDSSRHRVHGSPMVGLHYAAPLTRLGMLVDLRRSLVTVDEFGVHVSSEGNRNERAALNSQSENSLFSVPFASSEFIYAMYSPTYVAAAEAYTRMVRNRRWTLCGLAIKEFQLKNQRWPTTLDELSKVGLSKTDRSAFPNVPFGYRVADDDSHVLLWTTGWNKGIDTVESEPPSTIEDYKDSVESMEMRIE